uniref:Uncharacterized protein n=1 Tax=viral metagenome TaxID=1070528 RepID=A0A6M3KMA3_9ZZZZ
MPDNIEFEDDGSVDALYKLYDLTASRLKQGGGFIPQIKKPGIEDAFKVNDTENIQ